MAENESPTWTWRLGAARPDLSTPLGEGERREFPLHIIGDDGVSSLEYLEAFAIKPLTDRADLVRRFKVVGALITGNRVECVFTFNDEDLSQQVEVSVLPTELTP